MNDFRGAFFLEGDDGYEQARVGRVFNGRRPSRFPAAILEAADENDVVLGVQYARANGLAVAVRSGGHSWAVWSVQDGTLLIDLGLLREASIDTTTWVVTAGPAIKGGDELSPYLEEHGRFWNGGHCPSVGIGGFILQGGQGWNQRGWGWGAESLVAIDVVTADGELVHCDETQNQDLFWAARGAGPSFPAIVTRFHLETRPHFGFLGHTVHVYPVSEFAPLLTWLYEIHASVSEDVEIVLVGLTDADTGQRQLVLSAGAFSDSEAEAKAALAPFNTSPVLDRAHFVQDAAASTLAEQRVEQERANPEHSRYISDCQWVEGETAAIVDALEPLFTDLPTPQAFSIWMSNAPMRPLKDMAFSLQTEAYTAVYMVYDDESRDAELRSWINAATKRVQPVTAGQYLGDSDMTNRQLRFMADENFAKLQEIITTRDPEGRFVRYLAKDSSTVNRNHWQL